MNAITGAIDELSHLRIPSLGLVAKVDASFEQLTHGELWKSQSFSFPVFALTGEYELLLQPEDAWGCLFQMPEPRLRISIAAYTAAIFMTQGEIYIVVAF